MTPTETISSLTLGALEPRWTKKPNSSNAKCTPHPTISVYTGMHTLHLSHCGRGSLYERSGYDGPHHGPNNQGRISSVAGFTGFDGQGQEGQHKCGMIRWGFILECSEIRIYLLCGLHSCMLPASMIFVHSPVASVCLLPDFTSLPRLVKSMKDDLPHFMGLSSVPSYDDRPVVTAT